MKTVTAFQSEDGKLFMNLQDALEADVVYWKTRALKAEPAKQREDDRWRDEYGYPLDGTGHQ